MQTPCANTCVPTYTRSRSRARTHNSYAPHTPLVERAQPPALLNEHALSTARKSVRPAAIACAPTLSWYASYRLRHCRGAASLV
eukprot:6174349-Pleurochrysis_carterae.AAC.1